MAKLDEMDRRERRATLNKTIKALRTVLANPEGFKRLRAISNEEWREAEEGDNAA